MASFLDEFIKDNGLQADVGRVLTEERFNTLPALSAMSESDLDTLKLKRGDIAVLRAAVKALQEQQGKGPMCQAQPIPQQSPKVLLDTLLRHDVDSLSDGVQRVDLDPQVYLLPRSGETKPLLIPDFVPQTWTNEGEEIDLGGAKLKLPHTLKKPKLSDVSPSMWISANARIMAKLHASQSLSEQGLRDYMAYTAKVGELASRFTWLSVLQYDNEYRLQQASMRFRWGSDSQHLATVMLRERPSSTYNNKGGKGDQPGAKGGGKPRGPSGRFICLEYNKSQCSFGTKCNYDHVCLKCKKAHSEKEHTDTLQQNKDK